MVQKWVLMCYRYVKFGPIWRKSWILTSKFILNWSILRRRGKRSDKLELHRKVSGVRASWSGWAQLAFVQLDGKGRKQWPKQCGNWKWSLFSLEMRYTVYKQAGSKSCLRFLAGNLYTLRWTGLSFFCLYSGASFRTVSRTDSSKEKAKLVRR